MRRGHDPYLLGYDQPALLVPADVAAMLWPAIAKWVAEHEAQGATAKLRAVEPVLVRWRTVAAMAQSRSGVFARERAAGDGAAGSSPSGCEGSPWLTVGEAAERLEVTPQHVTRLARQGDMDGARKVGRDWVVTAASVESLRKAGVGGGER